MFEPATVNAMVVVVVAPMTRRHGPPMDRGKQLGYPLVNGETHAGVANDDTTLLRIDMTCLGWSG